MGNFRETSNSGQLPTASEAESPIAGREPDGLYQKQTLVARVNGAEVDTDTREVRMDEVYQSDNLIIPEECEFQNYRIQIQRIKFASRIDTVAAGKGRVLRGVIADILGSREA